MDLEQELKSDHSYPPMIVEIAQRVLNLEAASIQPTGTGGPESKPKASCSGLCADVQCTECNAVLAQVVTQTENTLFEDIDNAARAAGLESEMRLVATAFNQYREGMAQGQESGQESETSRAAPLFRLGNVLVTR